jgi:hypothetical protein
VSGVSQQRLSKISQSEAVGNVKQSIEQSETITQYLFDFHQEVKRRVYTSLIEVAKIAWRKGLVTQYVNDDLTLEILQLEEFEFENSEMGVFVSNLDKDKLVKQKLDQLSQIAMEQQKADLSDMIDTVLNDSPKDIVNILRRAEQEFYQRQQQSQEQEMQMSQEKNALDKQLHEELIADKQADRDLKQYEIDANNQTKITVAEIAVYNRQEDIDINDNSIPDPMEIANHALEQQRLQSDMFSKQSSEANKVKMNDEKIKLEKEKLASKEKLEQLKIKAIETQNKSQEKIAKESNKLKEKEIAVKKIAARKKPSGK